MTKYTRRGHSAGHNPSALHAGYRLARSGFPAHSCKYVAQFINRRPVWPHGKHGFQLAEAVTDGNSGVLRGVIGWKLGHAELPRGTGCPWSRPGTSSKPYRVLRAYGRGGTRREDIVDRACRSGNSSRRRSETGNIVLSLRIIIGFGLQGTSARDIVRLWGLHGAGKATWVWA